MSSVSEIRRGLAPALLGAYVSMLSTIPLAAAETDADAIQLAAASADAEQIAEPVSRHAAGTGFRIFTTEEAEGNFRLYASFRYLNQLGLDETYTDAFGQLKQVDRRQDFQFQKVLLFFYGWFLDPNFRYLSYVWTANTSQGLSAQVVVAGNLSYRFNEHFNVGVGINGLPGARSTEGQFPNWLGVDDRLISDEFFRPSYTSGIWVNGKIVDDLRYHLMLGNNLSQLGVDAGQLDNGLDTWSGSLTWMPTTGEFGRAGAFGDYDRHEKLATRLGAHFTTSDEDRQSQPNTESFDNVQVRLSDGNVVFQPGLFGTGIAITDVMYRMSTVDAGLKYRGFSAEGEYYWRWLDDFRGPGTDLLAFDEVDDHGFQLQTSAMLVPETLQFYLSGSKIFGDYGDPSEVRAGVNWFPWKTKAARWNAEFIHLDGSPVGALSLPYPVGGNGPIFHANLEVNF